MVWWHVTYSVMAALIPSNRVNRKNVIVETLVLGMIVTVRGKGTVRREWLLHTLFPNPRRGMNQLAGFLPPELLTSWKIHSDVQKKPYHADLTWTIRWCKNSAFMQEALFHHISSHLFVVASDTVYRGCATCLAQITGPATLTTSRISDPPWTYRLDLWQGTEKDKRICYPSPVCLLYTHSEFTSSRSRISQVTSSQQRPNP